MSKFLRFVIALDATVWISVFGAMGLWSGDAHVLHWIIAANLAVIVVNLVGTMLTAITGWP